MTSDGPATRRAFVWVALVLVVGLVTTMAGVLATRASGHRAAMDGLHRRADLTGAVIRGEILRYEETLSTVAASLSAQTSLEAEDFRVITGPLLDARLNGASGLTFMVPATTRQTPAVEGYWRGKGATGLELQPVGPGPEHVYAVFSRAFSGIATEPGRDLSTVDELTPALQLARGGQIAITRPYVMLKDRSLSPEQRQLSLVLVHQVIDIQSGRLRGWVAMGLRGDDLLTQSLAQSGQDGINVTLTTGQSLGESPAVGRQFNGPASDQKLVRRVAVPIGQQEWTLTVQGTDAAARHDSGGLRAAVSVLVGGVTITVLLVALIYMLVTSRQRALRAVDRATADLREAEERFRFAFDRAHVGMALIDLKPPATGQFLRVNEALLTMLGYSAEALLGCTVDDILMVEIGEDGSPDPAEPGAGGASTRELRYRHRSGHAVWVLVNSTVIRNVDGEPAYCVTEVEDITARRAETQRLSSMALQDQLTGLGNRLLLEECLAAAASRSVITRYPLGVIFCDVDQFKPINDTHGHAAGDAVLREIAQRLRGTVRPADTIARIGGDEFVVLCEDLVAPLAVERVAERIQEALEPAFALPDGSQVQVSCSLGTAVAAGPEIDVAQLLHDADAAMYRMKNAVGHR